MPDQKKIVVMGLGLYHGGEGVAEYFARKGEQVLVTDLLSEKELKPSVEALKKYPNIEFVLGQHRESDFENAKIVFANPRVPPANKFLTIAKAKGIPVFTEMSYFFENKACKVIGVTGTRGKSTTTNLTYQILKHSLPKVVLGGSIGVSVMPLLATPDPAQIAVLEISNLMLEYMRELEQSPEIAAITNISVDHLDRHGTMEEYVDVKSTIFKFQDKNGIIVLNNDNEYTPSLKKLAKGKVITFGSEESGADYCVKNGIVHEFEKPLFPLEGVIEDTFHPLAGEHNKQNILVAVALARTQNASVQTIEEAIINYEGLYGRQMYLGKIKDVHVVNDTCANSPSGTIEAFKRFADSRIVLISGGTDVGLDFKPLVKVIKDSSVKAILLVSGSGSDALVAELKTEGISIPVVSALPSLDEAVSKAFEVAKPNDLILFSPGCKSFEMFVNQTERGKKFDEIVGAYKNAN